MTKPSKKNAPKKNPRGRPRVTREVLDARIADYCERYDVKPGANYLPPFPSGRRETTQHREWIGLYKVQTRLAARGDVYGIEERREALNRQRDACAVCGNSLDLDDATNHTDRNGALRGVLHKECKLVAVSAERLGVDGLDRLKGYLFGSPL